MKASKSKAFATVAPASVSGSQSPSEACSSQEHIATAAYYKAEARGFVPGGEVDDWLSAEDECRNSGANP